MRVLVTGATGFVGRAVVRRLLLAGHQPVALVHQRTAPFPGSVPVIIGSVLDQDVLDEAAARVDAVCHLAATTRGRESLADPLRYFRVNVDGTLNVLEALAKADTPAPRIVFTSTCLVYGEPAHQPISEAVVPQPTSPYGQAKLAAEWAVAAHARTGAAGATIIRTFNAAGAVGGSPTPTRPASSRGPSRWPPAGRMSCSSTAMARWSASTYTSMTWPPRSLPRLMRVPLASAAPTTSAAG